MLLSAILPQCYPLRLLARAAMVRSLIALVVECHKASFCRHISRPDEDIMVHYRAG
jgi:hypothetical protein